MTHFISAKKTDSLRESGIYLVGINFDETACFRKGASLGPNAIREASDNLETYSPYFDQDLEEISLFDLGNIKEEKNFELIKSEFENKFSDFDFQKSKLITLGGEHSISISPLAQYIHEFNDLCVIQLDAHADLRVSYEGNPESHACIMNQYLKSKKETQSLIQFGIRSGTKEEFSRMKNNKTLKNSLAELKESIKELNDKPIYLTLDLDFFDPSIMPGTGTVEAGGHYFHEFIEILKVLKSKNFRGADIVELAPPIDPSGNSNCFASKVLRETILAMS